jgi:DNA-binding XRE family transcriptional regulator
MLRIEHGTENPTLTLMQAIADLHKLKLSQLIARAEHKHANCSRKKD